jgi:anti-anti-sigma regulatory factor
LPVIIERRENGSTIRLEGEINVTSAAELKLLLLEGLASGQPLHLNLERADEIDVTILQLLWAAGRDGERAGAGIEGCISEAAAAAARDAGFARLPGFAI